MLTLQELDRMREHVRAMVAAVDAEDADTIRVIYQQVGARFHVNPSHALAVLLAEEVTAGRKRLAVALDEGTRYAEAYLDEKRRVAELRDLLNAKVAASTATQNRRSA